jgi:hypothetical protein
MSRTWLRNLANCFRTRANRRTRRIAARGTHEAGRRRLQIESLENRVVPSTTIMFQQGSIPNGDVNPYAGTTEVRIDNSNPNTNIVPDPVANTNGFYFMDGTNAGDLTSPNQWDLIRFDNIFGPNPGQVPVGSIIRSATLNYYTGTSSGTPTDSGSSPTGGPFGVVPLNTPFTTTTTWNSFAGQPASLDYGRAGPLIDVQGGAPVAAFHNASAVNGYALSASSTPTLTAADVTNTLQQWALNPATNYGFNIRELNTNDGWGVRTIGNANVANRPALSITFDAPPTSTQVVSFQQGVNGYADTTSVWLQMNNTSTDGNTIVNPSFLDGNLPSDPTSPDDQMLLKFGNLFGSGPGQIPVGSTINSARLVMTTGGLLDSGNANTAGAWAASQVLVDWPSTTHYQDAIWGGDGPTFPGSKTSTITTPGSSTTELSVLSLINAAAWDQKAIFDVTNAVQAWAGGTANYGLDVQATGTSDGWQVFFSGANSVSNRPQLLVYYAPPASTEPAANTVDLSTNGVLSYNGGAGLANNVSVSLSSGNYTITDPSGAISLTAAAQAAGWTGNGTNSVTGPSSSFSHLTVNTGTGVDTINISGADHKVSLNAGGQVADAVNITGPINSGGGDFTVTNADTITATAGSLINTGTGFINLNAMTGIGTASAPILTQAGRLDLNAGSGGAFVTEADGAAVVANVVNGGALTVNNLVGTLTVNGTEAVKTDGGAITLSSGDDVVVNGFVGDSAATSAGLITVNANTDGAGTNGYLQGNRSGLATTGSVTINVNTAAGGTGNATLAPSGVGGTMTVNSNGGNILWNPALTIPADSATTDAATLTAANYVFTTTAPTGSIGSATNPIQTNCLATADNTIGNSTASLTSGSGGIFLTDWGLLDLTVTKAFAAGAGNIQLVSANYLAATNTSSSIFINGPIFTETGSIVIRSDDNLTLGPSAVVGGTAPDGSGRTFVGTVSLLANQDLNNEQRLTMQSGSAVVTGNTTANAVLLQSRAVDTNAANATIGGIDLANITVGNGGTITVDTAPTGGTFEGNITQAAGTVLNAGASGRVVLHAVSLLNAGSPANGAGIGTSAAPILTQAGTVSVTATNSPTYVTEADGANFVAALTGPGDLNLASITGLLTVSGATNTDAGNITLTSSGTGGGIRVNAALGDSNTGNMTLDVGTNNVIFNTAFTTLVGQTVTMNDGNGVDLGVTTTNNGTIVAANGVKVGAGDTLQGAGAVTGPVVVNTNGQFSPAGPANPVIYNTGDLHVGSNGILVMNAAGTTPGTNYDQINVTGTVDVTGGQLRLNVGGGIAVGNSFTIINNDGTDPVVGQFIGGTTIRAFNNPLVTFSINYAGGDGNDVVATVSDINPASALLDVNGNAVVYFSNVGINNNVTLTQSAGNYTLHEGAGNITLSSAAIAAGWTGNNSSTVTGPSAGVATFSMGLSDGNDTIAGAAAGAASLSLNGSGNLTIAGAVTTSGTFGFDEFSSVTDNAPITAGTGIAITGQTPLSFSGTGQLTATAGDINLTRFADTTIGGVGLTATAGNVNLSAGSGTLTLDALTASGNSLNITGTGTAGVAGTVTATGPMSFGGGLSAITATGTSLLVTPSISLSAATIGANGSPVLTQTASVSATGGDGGVYVTEADGATFTASATGPGNVSLTSNSGTLTVNGPVTAVTGSITLSSGDDVSVNAAVGGPGTSGTININANTDGAGANGYTQTTAGNLQTTNTTGSAATIIVNTPGGGSGNAVLGTGSIGANAGGTIAVTSNGGSILFNSGFGTVSGGTLPNPVGGSDGQTLHARNYVFTSGGSIGSLDTPIQSDNYASADTTAGNSTATLQAGTGGIYWTDWGSPDLTIPSAITNSGDIQLFSANAGGHNLIITGQVYTGAGNISLAADDDLYITGATIGGIGAQGSFGGTILLQANRDNGNEQRIRMDGLTQVVTTNASATAIQMFTYATDNDPTNATLGGVTLGTVTTGDGGTVTVDTGNGGNFQGNIIQILGTRVNVGPTGHIVLRATNLKSSNGGPAVGAGIRFDLDGSGVNTGPLQVFAHDVTVFGVNTPVNIAEGDGSFYLDADGLAVAGVVSGPGDLQFASYAGPVTVVGPTNTDGGALTVSANGTGGGVTVNAPLGDSNTGNILVDAGPNDVVCNSTLTVAAGTTVTLNDGNHAQLGPVTVLNAGSTLAAVNGVELDGGATLYGVGTVTAPLFAMSGSAVSPGLTATNGVGAPGTLATHSLSLTGGTLAADLNNTTAGTGYDQIDVTGTVDVTGAVLKLYVNNPTLTVGSTFTLINNDGSDAVVGSFAGGPTLTAVNDPRFQFTISTTGGDGNDVVATLTNVLPTVLDVNGGQVQFSAGVGINDNLTVGLSGGNYTVTDTATNIGLTSAAIAAGWTGNGTHVVTGPAAGLTNMTVQLTDGTDTLNGLTAGIPVTVSGVGTLNVAGAVNVTGDLAVSGFSTATVAADVNASNSITFNGVTDLLEGTGGTLASPTLTLNASDGIGTSAANILTQAGSITVSAGNGGIYVTEADGATVAATATGSGNVSINNTTGTLTVGGLTSTASGYITLSSGDAIVVNAEVGQVATVGTITIDANTDGAGNQGYSQTASGGFITSNNTAQAVSISVNTTGGGTGDAVLGLGSVGNTSGGTLTVDSNGGNILWALPVDLTGTNNPEGGSNSQTLHAHDYIFTTTAATGAIGSAAAPIQTDNYATTDGTPGASNATLNAGDGGIYLTDWGGLDLTIASAIAHGAGNVQLIAANAGGHNLWVTGPVTTDTGNIFVAADDDLNLQAGAVIGGPGFSGTIALHGSRDTVNEQNVNMDPAAVVSTTNNSSTAVVITDSATDTNTSDPTIGGVVLSNVTVGAGGTISVDAASLGTSQGRIAQQPGTHLDAGANGTVILHTVAGLAGSAPAVGAGIGTAAQPIMVTAGTVTISAGNSPVYVTDSVAGDFAASVTGPGSLSLATTAGGLTISGPTNTDGGAISLIATGTAGVVVVGNTLGDSNSGAISVSGPLSGAGSIVLGNGGLTVDQASDSVFSGTISGGQGVTKQNTGSLTLMGASGFTGPTAINGGTLVVTGNLSGTSGETVGTGATLTGTGTVAGPASVSGTLAAGAGGTGVFNTGSLGFSGGTLAVKLNGTTSGTSYDQVNVTGTVNLTGAALTVNTGFAAAVGNQFTIINNDGTDAVTGTFNGLAEGATVTAAGGQTFTMSYVGGDGNDVVLTRANSAPTTVQSIVVGDGTAQRSEVRQIVVTFSDPVTFSGGDSNAAAAFQLLHTAYGSTVFNTQVANLQTAVTTNGSGQTVVTITFTTTGNSANEVDPQSVQSTAGGPTTPSLGDGKYQLTILASNVSGSGGALAGDGTTAGTNFVTPAETAGTTTGLHLWRLFGDSTGEGIDDLTDLTNFRNTYNSGLGNPAYRNALDADNDGVIDLDDLTAFRNHYNHSV